MKIVPVLVILLFQVAFHAEIATIWDSSTDYHESALLNNWICVEYSNLLWFFLQTSAFKRALWICSSEIALVCSQCLLSSPSANNRKKEVCHQRWNIFSFKSKYFSCICGFGHCLPPNWAGCSLLCNALLCLPTTHSTTSKSWFRELGHQQGNPLCQKFSSWFMSQRTGHQPVRQAIVVA